MGTLLSPFSTRGGHGGPRSRRFKESVVLRPPSLEGSRARAQRARRRRPLTHRAVGVSARPERRDASRAPPFPAHRCSACALDQLFPSCPGCYKFSLPRLCRSFPSERAALQAAHACPQAALQAAHACPQASGAMLHQLKRAVTVCEDMEDTSPLKLRSKKKRLSTNFETCCLPRKSKECKPVKSHQCWPELCDAGSRSQER
ncbi:uncharacterized protein LOC144277399 [Eretmochelys imbricata]